MPNAGLEFYFQIFSLLASALVAFKLLRTGLYRRYPVFFWYCIIRVPDSLWPIFLSDINSRDYQKFWMLSQPVLWLFHVLLVAELYRLVLEAHRGIYSLGRWVMYGAIVVAVSVSILTLLPHFTPRTPQQTKYLGVEFAVNRGIDFALAIFLLLILFFLSRFPVTLSRNVVVHAAVYTIFFFSESFALFLRTLFGVNANVATSRLLMGSTCICFVAWLILLSRKGEEVRAHLPSFGPERERRALEQLEALNATLLKVSQK